MDAASSPRRGPRPMNRSGGSLALSARSISSNGSGTLGPHPNNTIWEYPPGSSSPYQQSFDETAKLVPQYERGSQYDLRGDLLSPGGSDKRVRFSRGFDEGSDMDEYALDRTESATSQTQFIPKPAMKANKEHGGNKSRWVPSRHPFWPNKFEPPHWPPLVWFTAVVVLTYPALWLTTLLARDKTLFLTRFIVGAACGILGFALGISLMELGKRTLEAATWATIIHHSTYEGSSGVTLSQFQAKTSYPQFTWLGVSLLFHRMFSKATSTKNRSYDKRHWSLFVVLFITVALVSASLSFVLGRLVDITTTDARQRISYHEVAVMGDLSEADVERAGMQLSAFESFISTWTLSPFGTSKKNPYPVVLNFEGEDVYLAETFQEQLREDGIAFGTFDVNSTTEIDTMRRVAEQSSARRVDGAYPVGSLVRWSRWGIRIRCEKVPDPRTNIVPMSEGGRTYVYVPKDTIAGLWSAMKLDPIDINFNFSRILAPEDELPANIEDYAWGAGFFNNGVAHAFFSNPIDRGESGLGWTELEMIMVRINTEYVPNASFGVYGPEDEEGTRIGYDAAVCIERIEPWIVDAYNATTGIPSTLAIVGKGDVDDLPRNPDFPETLMSPQRRDLARALNSTGKFPAFAVAHDNARNQLLKDNGRDFFYVPSPTVVSFTDGSGPAGYTSLTVSSLERSLGSADASNLLPFLSGSLPVVAFQFPDRSLASAQIFGWPTVVTLGIVMIIGYAAALLVPKLPMGVPRRDFGLFTWLAAYEADGLLHDGVKKNVERNMDLEEMERRFGDIPVQYGV